MLKRDGGDGGVDRRHDGGTARTRRATTKVAIVRDPNNLFLVLLQAAPRPPRNPGSAGWSQAGRNSRARPPRQTDRLAHARLSSVPRAASRDRLHRRWPRRTGPAPTSSRASATTSSATRHELSGIVAEEHYVAGRATTPIGPADAPRAASRICCWCGPSRRRGLRAVPRRVRGGRRSRCAIAASGWCKLFMNPSVAAKNQAGADHERELALQHRQHRAEHQRAGPGADVHAPAISAPLQVHDGRCGRGRAEGHAESVQLHACGRRARADISAKSGRRRSSTRAIDAASRGRRAVSGWSPTRAGC